jgi:hypothetical protein
VTRRRSLRLAADLALPLEAVTETFGVFGKRGRGKTNAAVVLFEELFEAGLPVVALDPIGAWWGVKSSADGKGPGLPVYVFGGRRGDLPLAAGAGRLVADLVVEQRISLILDLSGFSGGERRRFVTDFCMRLLERNSEPLHVILEEADAFCPQRPYPGDQEMLGATDRMVRWGRGSGIGCSFVTQRPAKVNKDVSSQLEVLVAFGVTSALDRAAIDDWIKYHDGGDRRQEVLSSLAGLQPGTAWVWSPQWLELLRQVRFRRRRTYDSAATPAVVARRVAPVLATVDLERIGAQMADAVQQAEANDPVRLRRRIAELERELARRPPPERVEVPVKVRDREWAHSLHDDLQGLLSGFAGSWNEFVAGANRRLETAMDGADAATVTPPPPAATADPRPGTTRRAPRSEPPAQASSELVGASLSASQRRILDALAWLESVGIARANRVQLAGFARQSPAGGGFANNLGRLRSLGLVEYGPPRMVALTGAGREAAQAPDVPPTSEALQEQVYAMVSGSQAAILRVLVDRYPDRITRAELAELVGQAAAGGGFANNLGRLRSLGWIDYPGPGLVRAEPVLFLERAS